MRVLLKNDSRLRRRTQTTTWFDLRCNGAVTAMDAAAGANFTYAKRNHRSSSSYCSEGFGGKRRPPSSWLASLILTYGTSHVAFPRRLPLRGWLNICLACPATNYEPPLRAKSAAAKSFLTDVEWSLNRPLFSRPIVPLSSRWYR